MATVENIVKARLRNVETSCPEYQRGYLDGMEQAQKEIGIVLSGFLLATYQQQEYERIIVEGK